MKVCPARARERRLEEFHRSSRHADGCQPVCEGRYNVRRYAEDRERVLARNERYRREYLEWLDSLKGGPCVDCGQDLPSCVKQCDHLPGTDKRFAIGAIRSRLYAKSVVLEEIAKCELVCATCHGIQTWARRAPDDFIDWAAGRPDLPAGWHAATGAHCKPSHLDR